MLYSKFMDLSNLKLKVMGLAVQFMLLVGAVLGYSLASKPNIGENLSRAATVYCMGFDTWHMQYT